MRAPKIIGAVLGVVLIGMQFVPVDRTNPPVKADFDGPADVKAVLKAACYDCHSNETVWPWYAYVAPMKFMVTDDVSEARSEYNLSEWGTYTDEFRNDLIHEIWEEVEEGHMPLPGYVWMHPEANLSEEQKAVLKNWAGDVEDEGEAEDDGGDNGGQDQEHDS